MQNEYSQPSFMKSILGGTFSLVGIVVIILLFSSFTIVDAGNVGVVKRLGAVQVEPFLEGFHLKAPVVDKVIPVDIRLINTQTRATSASKDLQTVMTQVSVQYSINGAVAPITYQKIGGVEAVSVKLVQPAILESVKAVTAKYTAEELVTQRARVKGEIQNAINDFIDKTLKDKNIVNALNIANVAITDFDFSQEFNRAIELKVKAEQEALQAKNEKIRRVTQAEAAASEKKLAAEADAYQIEIASKARADAIRREAAALKSNPELIQLRIAEKWDGKLPYFSAGKDTIPMINLKDMK